MTKQEFWKMIGYVFENYDITCANCPACGDEACATSCEQALKNVYNQLEHENRGENKCGDCLWLTKLDTPIATLTHYCKLHYTSEIRKQNEQACKDFKERDEDGRLGNNRT